MHRLLKRQLVRCGIGDEHLTEEMKQLLDLVSDAYRQSDQDRNLLEHSLELTSNELVEQNRQLREKLHRVNEIEAALRESEERYQLAVEGSHVGIWDWDIRTGHTYYSPAVDEILGYPTPDWSQQFGGWLEHVVREDRRGLEMAMKRHLLGLTDNFHHEYRVQRPDGGLRWVLSRGKALRDSRNRAYRIAGSIEDITQRKLSEQQARHDAIHDALTGLPNRLLLLDRLQHALLQARRRPDFRFALLFIDLDRFKRINDSFGHMAGDLLLKEIARRLQGCIKETDTLARLGGDEFVILLEGIGDEQSTVQVTRRLQQSLRKPVSIENQQLVCSASIGIVLSGGNSMSADELLRDADIAMYRAKIKGKDRYKIFRQEMHQQANHRLQLESELRKALDEQQFVPFYQPVVRLTGTQLIGFETLLRWNHPQRGDLAPSDFLHVAEEIGLMTDIDLWVLEQACTQLANWHKAIPGTARIKVNTNISPAMLEYPKLAERVEQVLSSSGLAPENLQLEITENCLIREGDNRALERLHQLKETGIQLLLDDFGTGYSSLGYLHRLPFDGVKLDRSLIGLVGQSPRTDRFVRAVLELAGSLNLSVVAEGIERPEQLQALAHHPGLNGQGYLFSRPLDPVSAERYLTQQMEQIQQTG